MGGSRGGLASKIHALVDADGRPVARRLTGGQIHDSQEAEALLEALPEGATLLADTGYDSNRMQRFAFSGWLYRQRNHVERFFNRIKQFRRVATRYDKTLRSYRAMILIACILVWMV